MKQPAILALADGSVFHGCSIGRLGYTVGEVIFNTAMTGYQEILTDPSYAEQIITFTYPHIGNVGVNSEDTESSKIWAKGLVVRDLSPYTSNWRSEQSLADYLHEQNVIGIADIDTRRLTHILRDKGAQNGCIMAGDIDIETALDHAKSFPGLIGADLAKEVTTKELYEWQEESAAKDKRFHVVVYDFGIKTNILRLLAERGCRLTVVPAHTSADQVLAYKPQGIFLSNGPGDPAACDYAIAAIKEFLDTNIPLFGICLGFQLLTLAAGAETMKMKFGHHGANHPIQNLDTQRVHISSQNHGFAVNEATLPSYLRVTHRSLFDQSIQGIEHENKPAFGMQGHPEASPGPHDIIEPFNRFIEMMESYAKTN